MATAAIKQLLKKVVRVDAPADAARPTPPWAAADNTNGNAWTIRDGDLERHFFFVTGCYKSGTHWVQNLLNLHPKVNVRGEFHFQPIHEGFHEQIRTGWYLTARPRLREVAETSFYDLIRRMMYVELTRDKPEATWLGDRTPRAMGEYLPGAPTINIIRDGRDVMVSWHFQHLRTRTPEVLLPEMRAIAERCNADFQRDPTPYRSPNTGYMADEWWFRHHARLWGDIVGRDLTEAPALRERGTPVLQIKYEDVHKDVAGAMRQMLDMMGLDAKDADAPSDLTRTLPGFDEDPTKFFRKGAVGEWKDYFTDTQRRWFKEEAGESLIRAGYEKDGNW